MSFNNYLPADCQGNDSSFPWNQEDNYEGEAKSFGSDCCEGGVKEEDGVIRCLECGEVCTEVFESEDELQERLEEESKSAYEDAMISRYEERMADDY